MDAWQDLAGQPYISAATLAPLLSP